MVAKAANDVCSRNSDDSATMLQCAVSTQRGLQKQERSISAYRKRMKKMENRGDMWRLSCPGNAEECQETTHSKQLPGTFDHETAAWLAARHSNARRPWSESNRPMPLLDMRGPQGTSNPQRNQQVSGRRCPCTILDLLNILFVSKNRSF